MKLVRWEVSFGLFTGVLLGYRQYVDEVEVKVEHVIYLGIFDCCISLYYE
jgi:hypothetical protein